MTGTPQPADGPRLYGNWRPERGWGIGALSTSATVIVFVAVLAPILAVSIAPAAALPLATVSALLVTAVVVRVGGVSAADIATRRWRFTRARAAGWTELSAGVLTDHPRTHDLPGLLAPLVPLDVDDGRGGRHALLWDRRTGALSAVLRCSPIGLDLAESDQADQWVASWGAFLADLGYQPLVQHVSVTVDTAPTGGTTMRDYIAGALDASAPDLARTVLHELAAITPATAADIDARLTITSDPRRATPKPTDLLAACTEVGRWLPGVEAGLGACGVAVLGRATTGWLTGRIRGAFDPPPAPRSRASAIANRSCCGRKRHPSPLGKHGSPTPTTPGSPCRGRCEKHPAKPSRPGSFARSSHPGRSHDASPGSTSPISPTRPRPRSKPR